MARPGVADLAELEVLAPEVARLEEARLGVLEDGLDADLACGRAPTVIGELEAHTRAYPLRERGWALRIRALYLADRQTEALATYREVRSLLAEEYGLEPGPTLGRLEEQILRHDPVLTPTPVLAPTAAAHVRRDRTPYIGRVSELAELYQRLDAAVAGAGSLVMIGGEPGVGKTRLSEELMAEAARRGLQVFAGHSYEAAGAAPYVAVVEILEEALARAPNPSMWRDFLGDEAAEIARLLPKLRRLCPDIPAALELPPEQERRLLFGSVRTGRCPQRPAAAAAAGL